ncbi:MAG: hypothetical protein ACI81P_002127 [Neolewinella sp.]|jgi:putative acetyltransferase
MIFPEVMNPDLIGTYPALVKAGGGYVWDAVLECRVWCHPEKGAEDMEDGNDYYYVFSDYQEAMTFHHRTVGSEESLALILQKEYIDEPKSGVFQHIKVERITEWPVEFLTRPRHDHSTIPAFFSPDAPANRPDILRGITSH